jgi:hypothetical protein
MLGAEEGFFRKSDLGTRGRQDFGLAPTNALNTDEPNYRWQNFVFRQKKVI